MSHQSDDPFADIDLDEVGTGFEGRSSKEEAPTGAQDTWTSRQPGEPLTDELRARAMLGLPMPDRITQMTVQLLDRGHRPTRGWVRYALKVEATDAAPEHCTRHKLRQLRRERWVNLSSPRQFRDNARRRVNEGRVHDEGCAPLLRDLIEIAQEHNAQKGVHGSPEALLGFVSNRVPGLGTITYRGQYGLLLWRQDEAGLWLPLVTLTGLSAENQSSHLALDLRHPSPTNRDGTPRQPSGFKFVRAYFSPALQERITRGREIREEREKSKEKRKGGRW
ncbi:hypothetical protein [Falsiroseomonas sp. E2-1-a20]|uniref:hypothetical protein n=1 Tax=Falsiroseomonas sp. E2-1-a20 TaxID=3239300 RepID=UPI003F325D99